MPSLAKVEQLTIFPVKSLAGISLNEAKLLPTGLEYDRFWMIVDADAKFITQRTHQAMLNISTSIKNDQLTLTHDNSSISVNINSQTKQQTEAFDAIIWKVTCKVLSEAKEVNDWLSEILNEPVRLVRMLSTFKRPQHKAEFLGESTHTHFADAAPYLVCNKASLDDVNLQLQKLDADTVSMTNFRPNIIISGPKAYEEHDIKSLVHPEYVFKHAYPCQRCIMPTIDLKTAKKREDHQPFKLLGQINPMPNTKNAPAFGENASLESGVNQTIKIGDLLEYS